MSNPHDWTVEDLNELYELPLLRLIQRAMSVHDQFHKLGEVQVCHLISIKTGGCTEDCKYCSQSSRYQTPVKPKPMMKLETALQQAKDAIKQGATRVCLGAAWRGARDGRQFEQTLRMVEEISKLGVEVCCTLGLLNEEQASRLKKAGLYAYNHNVDSSEKFYRTIITTRSYQDRLNTLRIVAKTKISLCCGGIIGMGESVQDRLELIQELSRISPESVPINLLSPIPGTPLEKQSPISCWELIRMIAVARIALPKAMIRLSSGRIGMSFYQQSLCFLAGANSIFAGEKLLTIANTPVDSDEEMFKILGLIKRAAYEKR